MPSPHSVYAPPSGFVAPSPPDTQSLDPLGSASFEAAALTLAVDSAAKADGASAVAGASELPPGSSLAANFDAGRVIPILDDPRLADVNAAVGREAYKEAADLLLERLPRSAAPAQQLAGAPAPSSSPTSPPSSLHAVDPAWLHQLGLLYSKAGLPGPAVRAFDDAAASEWTLADDARVHAARLLVELGESSGALVRLDAVTPTPRHADMVLLTRARALAALSRIDEAAPLWNGYLARQPRPADWQLEALRFARALLNQPSEDRAELAIAAARIVIHDSPLGRGVGEARELEQHALASLPSTRRGPFLAPSVTQLVDAARSLGDSQQGRETLVAVDKLLDALAKLPSTDDVAAAKCVAFLARGKALATLKRYSESSDALGTAIEHCAEDPALVNALYLGARSALRAGQLALARLRYATIESRFPAHRLADDARLHGAEAARALGDIAIFTEMLVTIAERYPAGDMVDDGLFTLAQDRMANSDWASAVVPLERAIQLKARGRPYWAEGRPQYFLARAHLELGERDLGLFGLAKVIREYPLGYYMLHAYSRLAEHDLALAQRTLAEALDREPRGDAVIAHFPELDRQEFLRAVELVRQGEGRAAAAELDLLGVREPSASEGLLSASATLLARIDAPAESHGVLRSSGQWDEHYPAGQWRRLWEVAYPRPYRAIVTAEAKRSRIPEHLAYAIMREESAFMPRASSPAGAYGLMQLILPTAERMAGPLGLPSTTASLKTPAGNIPLGCRYLSMMAGKFPSNPVLAIPSYNAGPGAPERWLRERPNLDFDLWVEAIPYTETRDYTKRVLRSMAAYAMLYGDGITAPWLLLPR
ncbi:MAG: lytic murein transglycosylase [Myxococcales bacterium]|nr:lytic murein transglycosylase [Myxococcales bacterium]